MTEAKHQQPNLFTDPNFVAMTPDSRVALAMLMAQPSHWTVLPGLVDNAENTQKDGRENAELRTGWLSGLADWALWRNGRANDSSVLVEKELALYGWIVPVGDWGGTLILCRMGRYIKATNLGQVETWAANWLAIPRGPEREYLRHVITEACDSDAELARRLDDLIRGE
jgi:hypothetical protein